ncbi:MAG: phosphoglycolate phosphatase [Ancalomicrobiaceae bacterium]|nr:phosphoglycolate phosphatase [Ancalomicrobiaceae bacterium]
MPEPLVTKPLLVFDLDGTIVDSAGDLITSLNLVMAEEGLPAIPHAAVSAIVGAGARAMIERGLRYLGEDPALRDIDDLMARFIVHYSRVMPADSRPYPGLGATFDRFEAAGWRFAVCTNKPEALSYQLLDALDISPRLSAICGGDTFAVRKPDARHLFGTIEKAGGDPADTIMVGDSRSDIEVARNAGIPVVAVTFGYADRPVGEFGPDAVIDHLDELWDAVAGLKR